MQKLISPNFTIRTAAIVGLFGLTTIAVAAEYRVPWCTIDSGGGRSTSADSTIELIGVIGQPDAGVMEGTEYKLVGGFLPVPALVADCNGDRAVDATDIASLANPCLTGPSTAIFSDACRCHDIDGDGDVDLKDATLLWSVFGQ